MDCKEDLLECEKLLADTAETPIAAILWSTPTPKTGITGEIVDFDSLQGDFSSVKGKWIFFVADKVRSDKRNIARLIHELAGKGAAGICMTTYRVAETSPNGTIWFNAQGCNAWYPTAEERRLPVFSITPLRGHLLEKLLAKGPVKVKGVMNCRLYNGTIATVTAVIPGRSKEEYALFAHLYEPFISDDASGFALTLALGENLLKRKVKLQKTLRVVFSMELYGFNAFLAEKERREKILAALSLDTFTILQKDSCIKWRLSHRANGFFGDLLIRKAFAEKLPELDLVDDPGSLSDDTFAGSPSLNIPTNWLLGYSGGGHHHNTGPFFLPDWDLTKAAFPIVIEAVEKLLTNEFEDHSSCCIKEFKEEIKRVFSTALSPSRRLAALSSFYEWEKTRLLSQEKWGVKAAGLDELELLYNKALARLAKEKGKTKERFSKEEKEAGRLIVTLLTETAPFSLAKIPFKERRPGIPDKALYALFDGKRTLLESLLFLEAQSGEKLTPAKAGKILDEVKYLAGYGYLKLEEIK